MTLQRCYYHPNYPDKIIISLPLVLMSNTHNNHHEDPNDSNNSNNTYTQISESDIDVQLMDSNVIPLLPRVARFHLTMFPPV